MFNTAYAALCPLVLTIFLYPVNFANGQGVLQVEPFDGLSQFRKLTPGHSTLTPQQVSALQSAGIHDDQSLEWRLPREVIPTEYRVKIAPNIDQGQEALVGEQWYTPGEVEITLMTLKESRNIVMHSKNITINSLKVRLIHFLVEPACS